MNAPCPGVKGHGIVNVPGAWYDLSARLDAARAVVYVINETILPLHGMTDEQRDSMNRTYGLAAATLEILNLCYQDIERLEADLKST